MTSEPILVVDEAPANLKLTQLVLASAGYEVRTARDAEEALHVVREFHPRLVLTGLRLPGIDGLELTRRLRTDPATHDTVILALTGCALETDEQKAMDAGVDGYIVKPYDTRKLPAIVRQHLTKSAGSGAHPRSMPAPHGAEIPVAELRKRFLSEGLDLSRKLIETLPSGFDKDAVRATFKRWAGLGNTLGRPQVARLAQQAEALLEGPHPQTSPQLREILDQLSRLFSERPPRRRETVLLPEPMIRQLSGKKLGLIGFDEGDARRLAEAFSNAHATVQTLEGADATPNSEALRSADLVVFNLRYGTPPPEWIRRKDLASIEQPILFVGPRDLLLEHGISLKSGEHDFLIWPWDAEEAVMRACLAMSRAGASQPRRTGAPARPDIVIADDDPTTVALVKATLESHQMACRVAADGEQALEMIQTSPPGAVILDVNMAALDGFEVLAALKRNEETSEIPVVFLTSRQQETDIVRAFGLGADDYIVKPFSPMELAARLKRLIRRSLG